jgi:heme/copper-type cytochrome/quinol oxidase subunit 3
VGTVWLAIVLVVSIYCIAQAVRDFRRGNRLMAVLGLACAVALWLVPLPPGEAELVRLISPSSR